MEATIDTSRKGPYFKRYRVRRDDSARKRLVPPLKKMMNDRLIRNAIHAKLIRHHHRNPDALVLDELGLRHGRSRVDVVVINGEIHGYEIKSDLDNLVRLPKQVEAYGLILDRVTIVVGNRLSGRIDNLVPNWWGIVRCEQGPRGGVKFHKLQNARRNQAIDPVSVAMLLWRREAVDLLLTHGCEGTIVREPRKALYTELARRLSISDLSKAVRTVIKARQNWRYHPLPL